MSKFAIRLLTLAMYATALVAVPMVAPAMAAEHSKEMKKHKKIHRSPGIANARSPSANPFPPMDEDPDRKAGGGGGY